MLETSAPVLRSAIVSSSRFRVEAHEHGLEAGETPRWSVVVTDTVTSEEIARYPPSFATEGEAREQAEFEIRNFQRRRSGEWESR
jgi:hypothetical protein